MAHTCNPSTQATEAGGLRVQNQLGTHNKNCLEMKKANKLKIASLKALTSPSLEPFSGLLASPK